MSSLWILLDMYHAMNDAPIYHVILEVCLVLLILWLLFRKSYNPLDAQELTEAEKEEIIREWTPDPLAENVPENHPALNPRLINGKVGKYIKIDEYDCLNLATHNFLGLVENKMMEETAIKCLQKYGVGSCGPRGFYGTVDVHLELEEKLAKFVNMEEAVVYSYGFSTIASAIPAYSKRADLIFVDECANFAIQKGLDASRSTIKFFKHNDMEDLEKLLMKQANEDTLKPKKAKATRRFLVVEGIYMNTGNIAPLPELIELRKKYKLRIFIDESISFGTLGKTGRGITEYYDIPVEEVDLLSSNLEWSVASIGGFCAGSSFIVEHQRLSGLGYCFSASLPPLLASAAITALNIMENNPSLFADLKANCQVMQESLCTLEKFTLQGHQDSPIKHLYLADSYNSRIEEKEKLSSIVDFCLKNGVAVTMPSYLEEKEVNLPRPSLRITANVMLTKEDIIKIPAGRKFGWLKSDKIHGCPPLTAGYVRFTLTQPSLRAIDNGHRLLKPFAIPEIFPHWAVKIARKPPARRQISSKGKDAEPENNPVEVEYQISLGSNISVEFAAGDESSVDPVKHSEEQTSGNSGNEKDEVIRRLKSQVSALQNKVKKLRSCLEETTQSLK